jgi:hypothetical protein
MASFANDEVRPDQPRHRGLFGIDHDFRRRVIAPGSMTGLALDRGKLSRFGCVAREAPFPGVQGYFHPRVGRRRPGLIYAPMTELAALRAHVGRAVSLRVRRDGEKRTRGQKDEENHSTETDTFSILSPCWIESTTS